MSIWFLLIADIHAGDAFAPWPPGFVGSFGAPVGLNVGQLYLHERLEEARREIFHLTRGRLDAVAVVGDAIQGKNKAAEGEYIIEPDLGFQGRAALQLIKPYTDVAEVKFVFRGSRYHVGANAETEEWMAQEIGAVPDELGHRCWEWMPNLSMGGVILDIAHHQSTVMINRSMPLERETRFSNQILDLKDKPHLIIRAHGHISRFVDIDGECALGLPALQLQNPYCKSSKTPNRMISRYLGLTLLEIRPDLLGTTSNPFTIHWMRFRHPPLGKLKFFTGEE